MQLVFLQRLRRRNDATKNGQKSTKRLIMKQRK